MQITKLFENSEVIFGKDETGKYYVIQTVVPASHCTFPNLSDSTFSTEKSACEVLKAMRIPQNVKGFKLILEAVDIMQTNPEASHKLFNGIYKVLSDKHNSKVGAIERNIRHAISLAIPNEVYQKVCGTHERLTNGQFLSALVNYANNN